MLNKALFLDRDGVINEDSGYVYKIENFKFIDSIFEIIKSYQAKDYLIFIVTNQSGIARGYYTHNDFNILTSWMIEELKTQNIEITKVYYCPHHPDITGICECRKPKNGMFLQAHKEFNIDFKKSVMIGDKQSDIDAAKLCGIVKTILL